MTSFGIDTGTLITIFFYWPGEDKLNCFLTPWKPRKDPFEHGVLDDGTMSCWLTFTECSIEVYLNSNRETCLHIFFTCSWFVINRKTRVWENEDQSHWGIQGS